MFDGILDYLFIFGAAALLIAQCVLFFKTRRLWLRLIPSLLILLTTATLFVLTLVFDGWDAVGFLLLTLCTAVVLGASVALAIILAIIKKIVCTVRARRSSSDGEKDGADA